MINLSQKTAYISATTKCFKIFSEYKGDRNILGKSKLLDRVIADTNMVCSSIWAVLDVPEDQLIMTNSGVKILLRAIIERIILINYLLFKLRGGTSPQELENSFVDAKLLEDLRNLEICELRTQKLSNKENLKFSWETVLEKFEKIKKRKINEKEAKKIVKSFKFGEMLEEMAQNDAVLFFFAGVSFNWERSIIKEYAKYSSNMHCGYLGLHEIFIEEFLADEDILKNLFEFQKGIFLSYFGNLLEIVGPRDKEQKKLVSEALDQLIKTKANDLSHN